MSKQKILIGAMNNPLKDIISEIERIAALGLNFIDLTIEPPSLEIDNFKGKKILQALKDCNLKVITHTIPRLPFGSPYPQIRKATLEVLKKLLDCSLQFGSQQLSVHYDLSCSHVSSEYRINWHAEILSAFCEIAAKSKTKIILENMPSTMTSQIVEIRKILDQVNDLGILFDVSHALIEGGMDKIYQYLDFMGGRISHIHFSSNEGVIDQHLPVGALRYEKIKWPDLIAKIKSTGYDKTITLEVFTLNEPYLVLSKKLILQWWNSK